MNDLSAKVTKSRSKKLPASSLFIEDDSLHFEYGHCLPKSSSCSVVHGHSSRISAEIFGDIGEDGMIIDFGRAKDEMKKVLKRFDHKFIISKKYASLKENRCHISFDGPKGHIELDLPKEHVILLDREATSENIASRIADEILSRMPKQVKAVKAFFFEGANKGASIFRLRDEMPG